MTKNTAREEQELLRVALAEARAEVATLKGKLAEVGCIEGTGPGMPEVAEAWKTLYDRRAFDELTRLTGLHPLRVRGLACCDEGTQAEQRLAGGLIVVVADLQRTREKLAAAEQERDQARQRTADAADLSRAISAGRLENVRSSR